MRIGLLGGTFNPIHYGHLRAAEEVAEQLELAWVEFVPAGAPPHKAGELASAEDRARMVQLAIEGNPRFRLCDLELRRPAPSYSVETVEHFLRRYASQDLFFILGTDAFAEISSWRDYRRLLSMCNFAVVSRPGWPCEELQRLIPAEVASQFEAREGAWVHRQEGVRLLPVRVTELGIAASAIRSLVRRGRSIRYLVPPAVERYIWSRGLYR